DLEVPGDGGPGTEPCRRSIGVDHRDGTEHDFCRARRATSAGRPNREARPHDRNDVGIGAAAYLQLAADLARQGDRPRTPTTDQQRHARSRPGVAQTEAGLEREDLTAIAAQVAGKKRLDDASRLAHRADRSWLGNVDLVEPGAPGQAEVCAPRRNDVQGRDLARDLDRVCGVGVEAGGSNPYTVGRLGEIAERGEG